MPTYTDLDRPAQFLKGVGPKRADLLAKLGLLTARDVLFHVPHRYEDASTVTRIKALEPGMEATIVGRVVSKGVLPTRRGLRIFQAVVRDSTGLIECSWPGQPFLDRTITRGDLLLLRGTVRFYHGRQFQPKEYTVLAREGEDATEESGTIFPVYPATEGLTHRQVRTLIAENLDDLLRQARDEDPLPPELRERVGVAGMAQALEWMHRPASLLDAEAGRRRLAFEELFFLQLLYAQAHHRAAMERPGIPFQRTDRLVKPFHKSLPFTLTDAQKRVLREIGEDMGSPRRMNRLLQGDVGSGKTIVALFAMLRAVENGYQAALMAPTEILAEQHARTLTKLLDGLPVGVTLLTGRMGAKQRREAGYRIASGGAGIAVGTHALIQESVAFDRLGLVVVDEQHRFGVKQRMALAEMGTLADMLVMSATPIPRSLALTLYGDLDVSVIDERPPNRRPVRTALRYESARAKVLGFVREEVEKGRQAYFVYPLVEESEKVDLKSATEEYERLKSEVYPDLRVALVHGQMHGDEKDEVMRAFAAGDVDVLVSTTVIEVGIDVPNATVMVVEHADRFGLSQLHQLRGRVGRGAEDSFCILLASGAEARERLKLFASTEDGFRIAEYDMRQRGYGDLFGARQTGLPGFRFADLEKDMVLLGRAQTEARRIVDADPELERHPLLRRVLEERYGERARMYHVG
ncbi:ATP-dependent DNA helicase RecG [Longimicrobium sp.]|uniref:ATP-dependent DNA helicase RecG n=1 Tax=Longimicrobium sp. TaxID=2029185 RepID=UPI002C783C91|nr:ATP-dependent DNA helicase RecG [Longimicrobium sp.]HSU16603.1 ATP-dependent DNA helicase RecG [Longimicrobium sp.]